MTSIIGKVLCKAVHLVENKTSAPSYQFLSLVAKVTLRMLPSYPGLLLQVTQGGRCHCAEGQETLAKRAWRPTRTGQTLQGYKLCLNRESWLETNRSEIFTFLRKCFAKEATAWSEKACDCSTPKQSLKTRSKL